MRFGTYGLAAVDVAGMTFVKENAELLPVAGLVAPNPAKLEKGEALGGSDAATGVASLGWSTFGAPVRRR